MIRSLDTIRRNLDILQVKQENISANAANSSTPGYKFQEVIQSTLNKSDLVNHMNGPRHGRRQELGGMELGNQVDEMFRHFEDGGLQQTGNPTNLALQGNGFFTVQTLQGVAYTRNGQFTTNAEGILTTQEGYPVLGQTAIGETVPVRAGSDFYVSQNGTVGGTGVKFLISDALDVQELQSQGDTLFTGPANQVMDDPILMQGYLESSNVEISDLMIDMMQVAREFEANQKVLHASDDTLRKATNDIGKL